MHLSIILLIVSVIFFVYSCYKLINDIWTYWYIVMTLSGISIVCLIFSLVGDANTSTEPTTYTVELTGPSGKEFPTINIIEQ
jgi:hypothetical protein